MKQKDPNPNAEVSNDDRALINKVSAFMRGCLSIPDANACYNQHHSELARLWRLGGWNRTECMIFKNLRDYQIKSIKKGWIK